MVICACAVGAVIFILSQVLGGSEGIPSGTPPVVIVTVLDPDSYTTDYINNIKENRMEYAKKHGKGLS
jgi:mannan polymerase II complex MNN11 subunit